MVFTDDFYASLQQTIEDGDILLIDEKIMLLHAGTLSQFESKNRLVLLAGQETTKSFDASRELIERLMKFGFKRNNRLIAIGGGIIQDAVSFVASILFRGVEWIFFPTTLLAQGDSCIGSKTSVNFGSCKNLLGGFHPPIKVFVDANFLNTLEEKEIRSGLGEMLHFFMIGGRRDFELFSDLLPKCFDDKSAICRLTQRSLQIKKEMIERDEFDQGPRKIFNYGHTFGHALEGVTDYTIPHGLAVCYGMDLANHVSAHLGFLDLSVCLQCREVLAEVWYGFEFPTIQTEQYLALLAKDKKNVGGNLNLILTRGLGDMFMFEVEPNEALVKVVEQCLKRYSGEKLCSK